MGKRKVKWRTGKNNISLSGSSSNGKITKHGNSKKNQLTILSVGEELRSSRVLVQESEPRTAPYVKVEIGKPMVIEYVRFRLYSDEWEGGDNELMISTFMESHATKQAAAEAITYFDKQARPSNNWYRPTESKMEGKRRNARSHIPVIRIIRLESNSRSDWDT